MAAGTLWRVPGLRVAVARRWSQAEVMRFERAEGEATWQSPWHRLALAETDFPSAAIRAEDGRSLEGPLHRGQIVLHPAGLSTLSRHGAGRYVQVLLDPALFASPALELTGGRPLRLGLAPAFHDPLGAEILRALVREADSGPGARLLVDGLATTLAVLLARRFAGAVALPEAAQGLSRERLRRVLDHVEAHLGEELGLARLAEIACLSPCHFSRSFKQAMGVGPHRYVTQRRVERAKALLRGGGAGDGSLAAIALAVGFGEQSHFTTAFRRETGMTPGRYRAAALA
jgi:AraC family transcriptional regulator